MSQATGSGGRNGSYQNWLAAGAFPVAVAAYSGVALAKEKAPLALPGEVVLYQYEACPFCNKVKAFLDYHDISYKVVEVNPIGKKELKWSEYKKVPVLVVDGEPLNDSTNIISLLDERIYGKDKKPVASNTEEEKWRSWVDDYFVHLLSPNIYRTPSEALEAFDYITTNGNFTAWERAYAKYSGAIAMYFVGKRLKKKHNIEDERRDLFQAADKWVDAVGGRQFMGGEKPNLADLAVFGVLRPIRNMQTGRDLMANSKIGPWYARMEAEVGESNRLSDAPHV
ncbi:Glutathione S-transferase family protein [Klebsormidium nitens]|uniref:Prostaglandin E synthase 2 n=1 Tax=Klebsormidium nitens TaxID=105231 RepID=A0A1Y1I0A0_KLENI|nr:Glutathione S-transferase family protein [Klebsormidium nitens]|eukprot:GAQ83873.1 Glutathione S-transferase family protein [Klebsormidium nitens]